jgi:hypothetical protein
MMLTTSTKDSRGLLPRAGVAQTSRRVRRNAASVPIGGRRSLGIDLGCLGHCPAGRPTQEAAAGPSAPAAPGRAAPAPAPCRRPITRAGRADPAVAGARLPGHPNRPGPDFVPVLGHADDAIIVTAVLRSVVRRAGLEPIRGHWPGTEDRLATVLRLCGLADQPDRSERNSWPVAEVFLHFNSLAGTGLRCGTSSVGPGSRACLPGSCARGAGWGRSKPK